MARHRDNSLQYYNQDTKDDDNLQYVEAVHGLLGYAIVHKLWKQIYGSPGGYYCEWKEINQRLFCKNNGITLDQLQEILGTCYGAGIEIFSEKMVQEHQILTSKGVQKRWLKIVKECGRKNTTISESYLLVDLSDIDNSATNQETPPPHHLTVVVPQQNKINESKGKESNISGDGGTVPQKSGTESLKKIEAKQRKPPPPRKLPSSVQEVEKYITEKMKNRWDSGFCALIANKFFNFYEANGWVQSKGKKIVSWNHSANMWIFNELEKNNSFKPSATANPPPTSVPREPIKEAKPQLTPEAKEKMMFELVEDTYRDFKSGEISYEEITHGIYDLFLSKSILTMNETERQRILKECNNDSTLSKKKAVAEFFTKLKEQNVEKVFATVE